MFHNVCSFQCTSLLPGYTYIPIVFFSKFYGRIDDNECCIYSMSKVNDLIYFINCKISTTIRVISTCILHIVTLCVCMSVHACENVGWQLSGIPWRRLCVFNAQICR